MRSRSHFRLPCLCRLTRLLLLFLFVALCQQVYPSHSAAQGIRRYQVNYGDTVEQIAQRFGLSPEQIAAVNGLTDAVLYPGQELLIPSRFTVAEHVVIAGENLAGIARMYGVDAVTLAQHNGIWNPDRLSVGQRLMIPAKAAQPTSRDSAIVFAQPLPNQPVGLWITVLGMAASPDNVIWLRAYGPEGQSLSEAWAPVHAELGQRGTFSAVLPSGEVEASYAITITAESRNLSDGAVRELAAVVVTRGR